MSTLFNGGPVEGGTFPAEIWQDFMTQALQIYHTEQIEFAADQAQAANAPLPPATGTPAPRARWHRDRRSGRLHRARARGRRG